MKSQGVKAYARVFPSLGIDPASVDDFEILGNSELSQMGAHS